MWVGRWYATAFLSGGFRIAVDPALVGGIERLGDLPWLWHADHRVKGHDHATASPFRRTRDHALLKPTVPRAFLPRRGPSRSRARLRRLQCDELAQHPGATRAPVLPAGTAQAGLGLPSHRRGSILIASSRPSHVTGAVALARPPTPTLSATGNRKATEESCWCSVKSRGLDEANALSVVGPMQRDAFDALRILAYLLDAPAGHAGAIGQTRRDSENVTTAVRLRREQARAELRKSPITSH
jgi:hypothetical protein